MQAQRANPGNCAAIVGVGNMGGGMAGRLLEQGWTVRVHDVDRAKVAAFAAQGAQTEEVLFGDGGAIGSLAAGQTVLLCPTIAPEHVEALAARLAERGVDAIDAPMSGGPARARDGTMSLMVACADAVFERERWLL